MGNGKNPFKVNMLTNGDISTRQNFMNNYWEKFYKKNKKMKPSTFAYFAIPFIDGTVLDVGCGNGRDVNFLSEHCVAIGIDPSFSSGSVRKWKIENYMATFPPPDVVYTRFFWHSITRGLQLKILKWVKATIMIEARTTEDKKRNHIYTHKRNYVNVPQLVQDLKDNGFQIIRLEEGEFSPFKNENPHLVRVIEKKT